MTWSILLIIHLVGLVGYSLLLRRTAVAGKFHPWVLATLLQTGIMVPMLAATPFLPMDIGRITPLVALVMMVVATLGMLLLVGVTKSLHYLEASTFSIIYSLRIVIVALLAALLLTELPSTAQLIGGLLILSAIVIVRQKGDKKLTRRGLIWGIGMACTISVLGVAEKFVINEAGVHTAAPIITATVGAFMWGAVWARRLPVPRKYVFTKSVIWLMILRSMSNWGYVLALAAGAFVSVATFVSSLSVVAIVALGAVVLGERDFLKRKIVAVFVASIGLAAVLLGSNLWPLAQPTQSDHPAASVVTHSTDHPDETKPKDDYHWIGAARDPKRIILPSIGVDAYIQNVGVDQNKQVAVPNNIHMGGWFVDSARPGDPGLSIIDGHLNGSHADGIFINLDAVKTGDTFTIEFGDRSMRNFRINDVKVVALNEAASVLFSQDPNIANQLTLITCGGTYDPQVRLYDKRVIVTSELTK